MFPLTCFTSLLVPNLPRRSKETGPCLEEYPNYPSYIPVLSMTWTVCICHSVLAIKHLESLGQQCGTRSAYWANTIQTIAQFPCQSQFPLPKYLSMETDLSGFVWRSQNMTENIPQSSSWCSSSAEPAGTSATGPSGPAPRLNWKRKSRNTRHWSALAITWSTCLSLFPSKPRGLCCRRYKTSPTCTLASYFRRAFFKKKNQKTTGSIKFHWAVGQVWPFWYRAPAAAHLRHRLATLL